MLAPGYGEASCGHTLAWGALQVQASLSDRTDALCNATLLNAEWRHCALNAAEERAAVDVTRAEERLAATQRGAQRVAERVEGLAAPREPSAALAGGGTALVARGAPVATGGPLPAPAAASWGAGRGASALRYGRGGRAFAGAGAPRGGALGAPAHSRGLWGGADLGKLAPTASGGSPRAGVSGGRGQGLHLGRGGRAGRTAEGPAKAKRDGQRWQALTRQVTAVQAQLQEVQQLQQEVGHLFEDAAREYQ